ncbi:uncharacterized protein MKK02DRAFT_32626 [Dioszegia hungarica]|uniref:Heme haloperoxidase family profile domain-containing protein n=1 Tax=Dioszegia hungarica TaxID=4972 RepID=A0AA38LTW3_9TREE|nr:uncharacterized protein MKK02DRAFT_32626 [Dioszegia hungarica]KAI9635128.1 hypothetical protein MKK02DRAFT_32626 [Dioszegia hungarica]
MLPHLILTAVSLLNIAHAFPWMHPEYRGEKPNDFGKRNVTEEKRLLGLLDVPAALTATGGLLDGLVGGVAKNIQGSTRVPDAAHPFQAPGPTDQRGPCPGLNALANHGYLPRNGIVTSGEVISAVGTGFNMGADLATLLIFIAVAFGGNLETLTFSLGGEDDRTYSASGIGSKAAGRQFGLDGHSRCEGDISALRRDFFTNNGDNHNAHPDRFKRLIQLAKENGGEFTVEALNKFYAQNAADSIANNPKLFFNSYTIVVILGEYPFIPNFFSNGTYGAGGVANYESISSLLGMSTAADGTICYVPERFPENWYRRATPYGVAELIAGLAPTYLTGPSLTLPNPLGVLQNPAQASQIGCAVYQGLTGGIPASLLGSTNDYASRATELLRKNLLPILPPLYGCDPDQNTLQETSAGGGQYSTSSGSTNTYNICA